MANAVEERHGGCPVIHTDYTIDRPDGETYRMLDAERELSPILWNDAYAVPFWVVQRHEHVAEILGKPEIFSSEVMQAMTPGVRFLPNSMNGGEHAAVRRILNRWFSPAAVRRAEPLVLRRCDELIDSVLMNGECEFFAEFAVPFTTGLLLTMLGIPTEAGPAMVRRVVQLFAVQSESRAAAVQEIRDYYSQALDERARQPLDPETDFLSYLLQQEGSLLSRADLAMVCVTLMAAGLHTTRGSMGYLMRHLDADRTLRQRLIDDPSLIPDAVEENVRLHNLVISVGRRVTRDIEFHGTPMREGDIVWIGNVSACRDPRMFDRPTEFRLDRDNVKKHLGWGDGAHRCLGMHLARHEISVVVAQWLRRIPDYEVVPGAGLREGGVQLGLRTLPLRWNVAGLPT